MICLYVDNFIGRNHFTSIFWPISTSVVRSLSEETPAVFFLNEAWSAECKVEKGDIGKKETSSRVAKAVEPRAS